MFTHCTFLYLQPRAQAAHETNPNPSRAAQRRPPHPKPQSRRHYPVAYRLPRRVARRVAHPTSAPRPTPPPAGCRPPLRLREGAAGARLQAVQAPSPAPPEAPRRGPFFPFPTSLRPEDLESRCAAAGRGNRSPAATRRAATAAQRRAARCHTTTHGAEASGGCRLLATPAICIHLRACIRHHRRQDLGR